MPPDSRGEANILKFKTFPVSSGGTDLHSTRAKCHAMVTLSSRVSRMHLSVCSGVSCYCSCWLLLLFVCGRGLSVGLISGCFVCWMKFIASFILDLCYVSVLTWFYYFIHCCFPDVTQSKTDLVPVVKALAVVPSESLENLGAFGAAELHFSAWPRWATFLLFLFFASVPSQETQIFMMQQHNKCRMTRLCCVTVFTPT